MVSGENEFEKDAVLFGNFYDLLSLHGIHYCRFFRALIDDAAKYKSPTNTINQYSNFSISIITDLKYNFKIITKWKNWII